MFFFRRTQIRSLSCSPKQSFTAVRTVCPPPQNPKRGVELFPWEIRAGRNSMKFYRPFPSPLSSFAKLSNTCSPASHNPQFQPRNSLQTEQVETTTAILLPTYSLSASLHLHAYRHDHLLGCLERPAVPLKAHLTQSKCPNSKLILLGLLKFRHCRHFACRAPFGSTFALHLRHSAQDLFHTLLKGVISTPRSPARDKLRQDLDRTDLWEGPGHATA